MENVHTLILAAGKSTRIAEVAQGLPKPLLPIAGKSIILHNLQWLQHYCQEAWINLHFQAQLIKTTLQNFPLKITLHFIEEPEILGTAGALVNAAQRWAPTWQTALIVYGDNLLKFNLEEFLNFHRRKESLFSMAVFSQSRNKHTGIAGGRLVIDDENRIQDFIEQSSATGDGDDYVNAGVYLIEKELMQYLPAPGVFFDFAKDFIPVITEKNIPIYAYLIEGFCLGMDTPQSFVRAQEMIEKGEVDL